MNVNQDWWYVRAYPGDATSMDEATAVLLPWLQDVAATERADRWFFVRYWDMTGHHLRLRARLDLDAADRVHARLNELIDLLSRLSAKGEQVRLVPGAALAGMAGPRRVVTSVYTPELAKYGGSRGVELAEDLFTASSTWIADNKLMDLAQTGGRAALAVGFLRDLLASALPAPAVAGFWALHRRQWGGRLRMLARTQPELSALLSSIATCIADEPPAAQARGTHEHVKTIVETLDRAGREDVAIPRPALLLHYLHMEMNRWGFMPAEECALGILAVNRSFQPNKYLKPDK
ncbi:thiopeptide-type bacteriocin biosynthesis protein [Nonomuraea typhae]|uniref:Thiopeptide-type bacteriocin biosynthesis protein n=1 Tax=Nonomuraea typhae TaxID=2603600 RepID=A0ABW7YUP3_9ACTN